MHLSLIRIHVNILSQVDRFSLNLSYFLRCAFLLSCERSLKNEPLVAHFRYTSALQIPSLTDVYVTWATGLTLAWLLVWLLASEFLLFSSSPHLSLLAYCATGEERITRSSGTSPDCRWKVPPCRPENLHFKAGVTPLLQFVYVARDLQIIIDLSTKCFKDGYTIDIFIVISISMGYTGSRISVGCLVCMHVVHIQFYAVI